MEALEFLKEAQRLCKEYSCSSCPVGEKCVLSILEDATIDGIHDSVLAIEQWSKNHPIITNAQKFEEVFGRPPKFISGDWYCPPIVTEPCIGVDCKMCSRWWEEPYKEPEVGQ